MTMLYEKIPKRGWIPLYVLSVLGKVPTATKLQKLVFLIQTEGMVDGYLFHKKHYGPYSEELNVDVKAFSQSFELMETQLIEGKNFPYYLYLPTQKGIETVNEIVKTKISKEDKAKVDEIVKKYGTKNYQELTEYVYKRYVIPEQVFDQIYPELTDDLISLESIWKKWYKDDCPASLFVLAMLEYQSKVLLKLKNIAEPVLRGVCVSSISELTAKLISLTSNCEVSKQCPFSFKSLFSEVSDQISFLDNYCGKQGIIGNIFDIDFSDFLNEEDLKRLEKEIAETPPSELMY